MQIDRKYCSKCRTEENIRKKSSYTSKDGTTYHYYMCSSCISEYRKKWYENGGRKNLVAANRRYRRKQIKF